MDALIVFNAVAYSIAALVMFVLALCLPRWYKVQYLISVLVFVYYAAINILYILGYFTSRDVSIAIRWVSVLMPMQLIGSAVVVCLLLKYIRHSKGGNDDAKHKH